MLPYSTQWIEEDDIAAVAAVMRSSHLTQGPATEKFEKELAAYLGVKHVVAVASGTAALHLVMMGLKKSFAVATTLRGFVPAVTFSASLNCFWYTDSTATLVDVDPLTGQMTPATLETALANTPRRVEEQWVVVPVSLQGRPLDYAGLRAVADKYGAIVVEDAAHAMGGSYTVGGKNFKMGCCAHSHASIASFHAVKQLCAGEGGAVITNDDALAASVRLLRSHGIAHPTTGTHPAWYNEQVELGYHYRITELQSALGLSQLTKLDARNTLRHELAKKYDTIFAAAPFAGQLKVVPAVAGHAYHLYVVHFKDSATRNAALEATRAAGIFTQVHYVPLYHFPYHRDRLESPLPLPGAEAYYRGCLSIPLHPKMTAADQARVVALLATLVV